MVVPEEGNARQRANLTRGPVSRGGTVRSGRNAKKTEWPGRVLGKEVRNSVGWEDLWSLQAFVVYS